MKIRLMTIDDYYEVYDLWIHTSGMGLNDLDDSFEGIRRFLKRNPTTNFVTVQDNKITGVILSGHDGRRGYIYHLAVLPEYRRQSIASQLVHCVMTSLAKEGIHKVALVAFKSNENAQKFWENVDFITREDLIYRNKNIHDLKKIDT